MAKLSKREVIVKQISRESVSEKLWIWSGYNTRRLFLVILGLGLVTMSVVYRMINMLPLTGKSSNDSLQGLKQFKS